MIDRRFDDLVRLIALRSSRRGLAKYAAAGSLAAMTGRLSARVANAQSTMCVECSAISCSDAIGSDDCHDQPCYAPMNEGSDIYIPVTLAGPVTICPCEQCTERDSTTCYYWAGSHYRHDACLSYPGEIGITPSQTTSEPPADTPPADDAKPTTDEAESTTFSAAEGTAMGAGDAERSGASPGPDSVPMPTLLWQFPAQMIRGGDPPPIAMAIAVGETAILSTQTEFDPGVVALDLASGAALWTAPIGRVSETPAMSGELVFATVSFYGAPAVDPYLYALAVADGTEVWRFDTGGSINAGPSVFDGTVYVSSMSNVSSLEVSPRVFAIQAESGEQLWAYEDPNLGSLSGTAVSDELVVVAKQFPVNAQSVLGLDRKTGSVRWQTPLVNNEYQWPIIANGQVLVRSYENLDQVLVSLDLATGIERWRTVLPGQPTTPAISNGLILIACIGGVTVALDEESGAIAWQIQAQQVCSAPSVTAGASYLSTWGGLLAIDTMTGETIWELQDGLNRAEQRPFVIDGKILSVLIDGSLAVYG